MRRAGNAASLEWGYRYAVPMIDHTMAQAVPHPMLWVRCEASYSHSYFGRGSSCDKGLVS